MPSMKHIHTYVQYKGRPGYFRCAHPQCTHFTEKEMAIDKLTCCTECGSEFILDRETARRAKPRCLRCAETKQARQFRAAQAVIQKIDILREDNSEEF